MVMGLPEKKCFHLIKKVQNRLTLTTCFGKIVENVGVNRAPVRIRLSGRVGDSGRDTFENENLIRRNKCFD